MFDTPSQPQLGSSSPASNSFMSETGSKIGSTTAALPVPPAAIAPPPIFGADTGPGKRPGKKPTGSFMGTAALTPGPSNLGSNTLLGQ